MINDSQHQTVSIHPIISRLYSFLNNDLILVWGLVLVAWMLMLLMVWTGQDHWLHRHDLLSEKSPHLLLKLLIFLLAWQVMIVAMILPSSVPLIR